MSTGFQPREETTNPRGLNYIVILRAMLVGCRYCQPGDIVKVDKAGRTIYPVDYRLDDRRAQQLIDSKAAKAHTLKPGDKVISIQPPSRPGTPNELGDMLEAQALEVATNPAPKQAERALSQRGKGGTI